MRRTRLALAAIACSVAFSPAPADAALRACKPVRDPYPGTKFAGVDLTRIKASGVACARPPGAWPARRTGRR